MYIESGVCDCSIDTYIVFEPFVKRMDLGSGVEGNLIYHVVPSHLVAVTIIKCGFVRLLISRLLDRVYRLS